jgi:hypothetical protein
MLGSTCPAHIVGLLEAAPAVLAAPELFTVMVPVAFTAPQPPMSGLLYGKVPDAVGEPLMLTPLLAQLAVTPAGSPVAVPMPVAPVVVCVIVVNTDPTQRVGVLEAAPTVLLVPVFDTVMVPVAFTAPQPPVKGMV